jgi:hypothetical protein
MEVFSLPAHQFWHFDIAGKKNVKFGNDLVSNGTMFVTDLRS